MAYRETVLVTGAAGGVGTHLVKELLARDYTVKATDLPGKEFAIGGSRVTIVAGDLADRRFVDELPLGVDHIIHAGAALDAALPWSVLKAVNVDATRHLWERAREVGVERFVFISAGAIYRAQSRPITEDDPQEPSGKYERSKYLAEKALFRGRFAGGGPDLITLRPGWVIGPYATALMASIATVPPLCKHFLGFAPRARGGPRSNMAHAMDVARAAVYFLERGDDGDVFNIANDDVLAFADYFNLACREYGVPVLPVPWVPFPSARFMKLAGPVARRPEPVKLLNLAGEALWNRLRQRYALRGALRPRLDMAAADHAVGDLVLDTSKARASGFELRFPDYRGAIRDVLDWYRRERWIP